MSGIIGTSHSKSKVIGRSQDTAKAWVNMSNSGTVNDSFNVSSVTDNSTGHWTPNWEADMANIHYSVVGTVDAGGSSRICTYYNQAVGSVQMKVVAVGNEADTDPDSLSVVIFGD